MNRAGYVALYAAAMTAALWAAQPPTMAVNSPESHAGISAEVRRGEETVDLVERLTERLGGTPARPGLRPSFIPGAVIVVRGNSPVAVGLATAISGRAGSIVAWVP